MLLVMPGQSAASQQARIARDSSPRTLPGPGSCRTFVWSLRRFRRGIPGPPLPSIRDGAWGASADRHTLGPIVRHAQGQILAFRPRTMFPILARLSPPIAVALTLMTARERAGLTSQPDLCTAGRSRCWLGRMRREA